MSRSINKRGPNSISGERMKKISDRILDELRLIEKKYHEPFKQCLKKSWVGPATFRCEICENIIYFGDRNIDTVDYLHTFRANGNTVRKGVRETDHISPVIPTNGFKSGKSLDWNEVIEERMFLPNKEQYQCVCKECHVKKSNVENLERRANNKVRKRVL